MITSRLFFCLLLSACPLPAAAKKTTATATGENRDLKLTVTLYIDDAGVKQTIGNDLGGHYIVADVKVEPKYGKEVNIDRDDFQLTTDKDYEKTTPFAPSQIAGRGALIVRQSSQGGSGATVGAGPGIGGGYPGTYPGGGYPPGGYPPGSYPPGSYPDGSAYPGNGGVAASNGGGDASQVSVTAHNAAAEKEDPLEKTLKARELPSVKTDKPVSGLLYFAMEKQKMKDLELAYGGKDNRITLRFR